MEGQRIMKAYDNNGSLCLLLEDGRTIIISPTINRVDGRTYQAALAMDTMPAPQQNTPVAEVVEGGSN